MQKAEKRKAYASYDSSTGSSKRMTREKNKSLAMTMLRKEWTLSAISEQSGYSQKALETMGRNEFFEFTFKKSENRFLDRNG